MLGEEDELGWGTDVIYHNQRSPDWSPAFEAGAAGKNTTMVTLSHRVDACG